MKLNRQEFASEEGRFEYEPSAGSTGVIRHEKMRHERVTNKRRPALRDHRIGREVRA